MQIIITSPSLDTKENVSGISSVTQFIINNNPQNQYIHFELGKKDYEKGGINRLGTIIKSLVKWNKTLNQFPKAVIHYNFPLSKLSILRDPLFMLIAKLKKKKMIIHLHGGNFLTAPYIPKLLFWILQKVFSMKNPFIVLSESEKNIIKNKFNCKGINILPNCVDLQDASLSTKNIKEENNPLTIGYLGRIAETKGMNYLFDACITLKQKNIPFILRVAGKEEIYNQYLPLFYKELGNHFFYDGVVSGNEKNSFLKGLDIFILPSFFEGLPISLLECMSYGVVPITTKVGSIGEVVEDEINGLFIKVKDSTSIVEQFIKLNSNRTLLNKLSIKAKQTITNKFNPAQYIQRLNLIYQSLK